MTVIFSSCTQSCILHHQLLHHAAGPPASRVRLHTHLSGIPAEVLFHACQFVLCMTSRGLTGALRSGQRLQNLKRGQLRPRRAGVSILLRGGELQRREQGHRRHVAERRRGCHHWSLPSARVLGSHAATRSAARTHHAAHAAQPASFFAPPQLPQVTVSQPTGSRPRRRSSFRGEDELLNAQHWVQVLVLFALSHQSDSEWGRPRLQLYFGNGYQDTQVLPFVYIMCTSNSPSEPNISQRRIRLLNLVGFF